MTQRRSSVLNDSHVPYSSNSTLVLRPLFFILVEMTSSVPVGLKVTAQTHEQNNRDHCCPY